MRLSEDVSSAAQHHRSEVWNLEYRTSKHEEARDAHCIAAMDTDGMLVEPTMVVVPRPAPKLRWPTRTQLRQGIDETRRALVEIQRQLDAQLAMDAQLVETEAEEEAASRAKQDAKCDVARAQGALDATRAALERRQRELRVAWMPDADQTSYEPECVRGATAGIFLAIDCPRTRRMLRAARKSLSLIEPATPINRATCLHCHCRGDHVCCTCGQWGPGAREHDRRYHPTDYRPGWAINVRDSPSGDPLYPDDGTFPGAWRGGRFL